MIDNRIAYRIFVWLMAAEIIALILLTMIGSRSAAEREPIRQGNQRLVKILVLTDLAVWTEARYTRHPSQADFFSAFQDGPAALEHFPAGAYSIPPASSNRPALTDMALRHHRK